MKWSQRQGAAPAPGYIEKIKNEFSAPDYIISVLLNRGIAEYGKFTELIDVDNAPLSSPWFFEDMEKAVSVILAAAERGEKIVIYGDYDADGVTSIVILLRFFRDFMNYSNVGYYIPSRQDEGYGMNKEALSGIISGGAKLIITVDCGITAKEEVEFCAEKGVKVIVTDHHNPDSRKIPGMAAAIINTKTSEAYPNKDLSGSGTAYKLMLAVAEKKGIVVNSALIDFAAIGTITDIVPMSAENRIIIRRGLKSLKNPANTGIIALKEAAGMEPGKEVNTYHVGYILGPRINAAGRLEHADRAVCLFASDDENEAAEIAGWLSGINDERKRLTQSAEEKAVDMIEKSFYPDKDFLLVFYDKGLNSGIAGLVASKLSGRFNRPSFVLTMGEDGLVHGSGRSVSNIDIYEALQKAEATMEKFGGHRLAAGITIKEEKIREFTETVNSYLKSRYTADDFEPVLYYDAELTESIMVKDIKILDKFEPWGEGNPKPVFLIKKAEIRDVRFFKGNTMKFYARHRAGGRDAFYNFILFRYTDEDKDTIKQGNKIDVIFTPKINLWNNTESIVLEVKDYR